MVYIHLSVLNEGHVQWILASLISVVIVIATYQNIKINSDNSLLITASRNLEDTSVGLVLQVFKRNSLARQLESATSQTLVPSTIIVLQNGFHVDVSETIKVFRKNYPTVEIQHIASSKNLRFHGRFYIAYMMSEEYVSVWDDDVAPRRDWLKYCVEYSKSHGNALVGGNGRFFINLGKTMNQGHRIGKNDFVGHTWTLQRDLLKHYITMKQLTRFTGEDIMLAFALQKVGIESHCPPQSGDRTATEISNMGRDKNASWLKNQNPRELLFCKLLQAGFKTLQCSNCNNKEVLDQCIKRYEQPAEDAEDESRRADEVGNNHVIWKSVSQ